MKFTVLFGSPKATGHTAQLLTPFLQQCRQLGVQIEEIFLYEQPIAFCLGCKVCQECMDGPGCVQEDGFESVFQAMANSDVLILATPIYAWYCTAPMKALLERAIYAGNKNYGSRKGPALLAGKRVASLVTCGYRPEQGADLWEEGLKRWCKHGKMDYLGMLCRRDLGGEAPFFNQEMEQAAQDFAQAIYLSITTEEL